MHLGILNWQLEVGHLQRLVNNELCRSRVQSGGTSGPGAVHCLENCLSGLYTYVQREMLESKYYKLEVLTTFCFSSSIFCKGFQPCALYAACQCNSLHSSIPVRL